MKVNKLATFNPLSFISILFGIFTFISISSLISCKDNFSSEQPVLELTSTWVRALPPGKKATGGYVSITNKGKSSDKLLSGSSEDFEVLEIHKMVMENETMKMQKIEDGLEIPGNSTVSLVPGGLHLMLINPKRELEAGKSTKVILNFEKSGTKEVLFPVSSEAPEGSKDSHPHSHH